MTLHGYALGKDETLEHLAAPPEGQPPDPAALASVEGAESRRVVGPPPAEAR